MPLFENGFKGNILTGLAIGIGATILAPIVVPVVAAIAKPLAKAAIKGGVLFYEKGRETVAEVGEVVEDLVAEAKMEIAEAHKEAAATGPDMEKTA
ncbi:MAG: DUF5132 domain-containing protein [Candidatus Manganitrophus sp.]|nr:DUF5132 domain-containing protein [Candidatus Manganitrophus sp.]MDC4225503.1 DUF5132 domain-containing protein [Candidatus Manganitrophus sp.]WDT74654.1 MAG: DUF5132 domain-containing protein [Candidatus Manganitrophus sp.]WDT79325.1 MAG: DUF5132 domain-containing protein [Candidatus Manganitrophus sp.]